MGGSYSGNYPKTLRSTEHLNFRREGMKGEGVKTRGRGVSLGWGNRKRSAGRTEKALHLRDAYLIWSHLHNIHLIRSPLSQNIR
jgi:hypothetical protein